MRLEKKEGRENGVFLYLVLLHMTQHYYGSLHCTSFIHSVLNLTNTHKIPQIITARSICMDLNCKILSSSNLAIQMGPSAEK